MGEEWYLHDLKEYERLRAIRKRLSKKQELTDLEKFELDWNKPMERFYKAILDL